MSATVLFIFSFLLYNNFIPTEGDWNAHRANCTVALQAGLEQYEENDETVNGFTISFLAELKAVESAPLVERAYQADMVDISVIGDYEDFQIEIGLLEKRLSPPPRYVWAPDPQRAWNVDKNTRREEGQRRRRQEKKEKKKKKAGQKVA